MSTSEDVNVHRSCKRNRSDAMMPIDGSRAAADNAIANSRANSPKTLSTVHKTSTISSYCHTIGGIYNIQTADIVFIFTTNDTNVLVPAHRSILAADSTTFYELFCNVSREMVHFHVTNTAVRIFCVFLTSFYAKSMTLHRNDLPQIIRLAYKFNATKCKHICHYFLLKSLETGVDDVLWILELILPHNCHRIYERCIELVHLYGSVLIDTQPFQVCSRRVLEVILMQEFVGRNEVKLFFACIAWARRRISHNEIADGKQIRRRLGDCFQMIRFTTMNTWEFVECLSEDANIFDAGEIQFISKAIVGAKSHANPSITDIKSMPTGQLLSIKHIFPHPLTIFRKIYNDQNSSDVNFTFVSSETRISAHKSILAVTSSMFEQKLFESNAPTDIQIKSTSPKIFAAFLKLLYGHAIDGIVKCRNLDGILELAVEYGVKDIFKGQEVTFRNLLRLEHIFWSANICEKYRFVDWMQFDCKWIERNCAKLDLNAAFHPSSLVHCEWNVVRSVIQIDYHNRDEERVLDAVINWAKNQCLNNQTDPNEDDNLRIVLREVLALMPLHKMTRDQFDVCQKRYPKLLNSSEIQRISMQLQ